MAAVSMGHHGPTMPIFHGLWPARRFFAWSRFLFVIDVYISPPPVTVTDYPLQFPMTSSGVSSYRDRTSEFRSLSGRMKKIGGMAVANHAEDDPATSRSLASASSRSEFNKKASRIGLGIHEACLKISRLAKLAKKSSMFNDPIMEIQELTALIKDDITALNIAVSDLQTLQNLEIADGNYSDDRVVHSNTVCDDLKNKLMGATKQLQDVLTTRTENIKAHENRKQIFSTNVSRENPFQQHAKTVTEPPPWSSLSKTSGNLQPSVLSSNGVQVGNQLSQTKVSCGQHTIQPYGSVHVTAGGSTTGKLYTKPGIGSSECRIHNFRTKRNLYSSGYNGCTARGIGDQD
ncbi:syntaxin-31 isoform X3 [Vitis vinifera]|uniref:syntaxin-31 isoform X3 n=1 Tax=Vitis vinifera TaxID=29760 RepID=UPI001FC4BDB3|nr:syntaxin-31 isoform X3 [Vitis vinifera]